MKTPFEIWLESQQITGLPRSLFRESMLCYKAGAYRAAMIMSYLAFHNIVKERILQGQKPAHVLQRKWDETLRDLRNDDKWDESTLNAIQGRGPDNTYFNLNDDTRTQYIYWKYRRNDAAHTKTNEITQSHIEMFWSFIKTNSSKFALIGSDQELINKFKNYFDRSKTPANKPYQPLVNEIPLAVPLPGIRTFFEQLDNILKLPAAAQNRTEIWSSTLDLKSEIASEVASFIEIDKELITNILKRNHHKNSFFVNPEINREIWNKYIFDEFTTDEFSLFIYFINHIIPDDQKIEAKTKLAQNIFITMNSNEQILALPEMEIEIAKPEYKEIMKRPIIERMDYQTPGQYQFWGSDNKKFIILYLNLYGIDEDISKKIQETFTKAKYPYKLCDDLRQWFSTHADAYDKLKHHLSTLGHSIPPKLDITATPPHISLPVPPPPPLPTPPIP